MGHAVLGLFFGKVEVAHVALPFFGQAKTHLCDERTAQEPQVTVVRGGVFEHRIAVAERALAGMQGEGLTRLQIDRVQ